MVIKTHTEALFTGGENLVSSLPLKHTPASFPLSFEHPDIWRGADGDRGQGRPGQRRRWKWDASRKSSLVKRALRDQLSLVSEKTRGPARYSDRPAYVHLEDADTGDAFSPPSVFMHFPPPQKASMWGYC